MTPMLLDDSAGCPGVRDAIRGRAAAICHACARFGEPGSQIEPMAKRLSGGEWFCPERRSTGTPAPGASVAPDAGSVGAAGKHKADCAHADASGQALPCGGDVLTSGGNGGVSL